MTVTSSVSRADYAGNGVSVLFTVPFRFLDDSHLSVILVNDTTTLETLKVLTTDYTVVGAGGASGTITMIVAPEKGETLVILRSVPLTQQTDYVVGAKFPAESHENALDKLTMIAQEYTEGISRTLRMNVGFQGGQVRVTNPLGDSVLTWNSAGTAVVNGPSVASIVAAESASGVFIKQAFTADGIVAAFTLAADPVAKTQTIVTINGIVQHQTEYEIVGMDVVPDTIPLSGDIIEVSTMGFLELGITSASLVSVVDAGGYYTATDVEAALQEIWVARMNSNGVSGAVQFSGGTNLLSDNANFHWDDVSNRLGIGTTAPGYSVEVKEATGGILALSTSKTAVVDGDKLGQINFYAPNEANGADAIKNAASIWAEADDTFASTVNTTDLVFAVGTSEAAVEKARLRADGTFLIQGNLQDTDAWAVTNPVPTANSGTFTTLGTTVMRTKAIGKHVFFNCEIPITTNGTAAGNVVIAAPIAEKSGIAFAGAGRANAVSGKALQWRLSGGSILIFNYDNTYPGDDGEVLVISGTYEAN